MKNLFLSIFVVCLVLCSLPALADQLRMKNGDVLTGTLEKMEAGSLVFKTEYAGTLTIKYAQVDSVKTEKDVDVYLSNGKSFTGKVNFEGNGTSCVVGNGHEEKVECASIVGLNRDPNRVKYKAGVNAGYNQSEGNSPTEALHVDGKVVVDFGSNRVLANGEVNNKYEKSSLTKENWLAYGEYDRFFTEKFYWQLNNLNSHDKFKDLELRNSVSTGPGYQFFKSKDLNLFASAGPAYVWEQHNDEADRTYAAGQWNLNFDWWAWPGWVQVFHRQIGLLDMEDTGRLVFKTWQGVRVPIIDSLYTTLEYDLSYDSTSPPGKKDVDQEWIFSLGYELGNY